MTEPPWFTAKVDQRLALVKEHVGKTDQHTMLMMPLTEPPLGATETEFKIWDRSCDGCGVFCLNTDFYTGHRLFRRDGLNVTITFGVCATCAKGFS